MDRELLNELKDFLWEDGDNMTTEQLAEYVQDDLSYFDKQGSMISRRSKQLLGGSSRRSDRRNPRLY